MGRDDTKLWYVHDLLGTTVTSLWQRFAMYHPVDSSCSSCPLSQIPHIDLVDEDICIHTYIYIHTYVF